MLGPGEPAATSSVNAKTIKAAAVTVDLLVTSTLPRMANPRSHARRAGTQRLTLVTCQEREPLRFHGTISAALGDVIDRCQLRAG
jgi:hypothetical protein